LRSINSNAFNDDTSVIVPHKILCNNHKSQNRIRMTLHLHRKPAPGPLTFSWIGIGVHMLIPNGNKLHSETGSCLGTAVRSGKASPHTFLCPFLGWQERACCTYIQVSPSEFSRDSVSEEPQENAKESVRVAALIVLSFSSTKLRISFPFDCIEIDCRKIKLRRNDPPNQLARAPSRNQHRRSGKQELWHLC
jgi:hypothetical protein